MKNMALQIDFHILTIQQLTTFEVHVKKYHKACDLLFIKRPVYTCNFCCDYFLLMVDVNKRMSYECTHVKTHKL
jgi:hypothetical protein